MAKRFRYLDSIQDDQDAYVTLLISNDLFGAVGLNERLTLSSSPTYAPDTWHKCAPTATKNTTPKTYSDNLGPSNAPYIYSLMSKRVHDYNKNRQVHYQDSDTG